MIHFQPVNKQGETVMVAMGKTPVAALTVEPLECGPGTALGVG